MYDERIYHFLPWRVAQGLQVTEVLLETLRFAAARRRLPMEEVDPTITLIGLDSPVTLLEQSDS
jgi:hypothetical protein